MLHLSVRLVFFFLSIATLGFSFERLTRVMASASVGLALGPGAALANEKTDFVKAASSGASIQTQLEKNIDKEKAVERSDFTEKMTGVRLIDLGGNRGARGLAASSDVVSGGSLVDQLKAYGGPGQQEEDGKVKLVDGKTIRVDNSIKNPLKYKNSVEEQLKVYGAVGGKR